MSPPDPTSGPPPVFGAVLFGGPLSGALIRDIRLANELKSRGYDVHVWWAMDRTKSSPLRDDIPQHWLFNGLRYASGKGSPLGDRVGRLLTSLLHEKNRLRGSQKRPEILHRVMRGLVRRVVTGVERDRRVVRGFARGLSRAGVTHVLPMLGILCPWAAAAKALTGDRLRYLVTFQGYELYVNYAREIHCEQELYGRLVEAVRRSDWPAIAVSEDYLERVVEDIGVPRESLVAIPPGIPSDFNYDPVQAPDQIAKAFAEYKPGVPLVTFLGRRDTEKGIDLLLYAAAILRQRGLDFQLAVCGPTLFGDHYGRVCRQLAVDLRCPVMWRNQVSDQVRSALFAGSRLIVYPSIHREPFGMVAVEALAHRTPVLVPDYGGIASAVEADGAVGGLRFRTWDSADLADQMQRLLTDDKLHRKLSEAGPRIAAYYSVQNMADRVLAHLDLPSRPQVPDR
jgi:glycosyltransferase involved in cell wall biosynthesis